MYEEVQKSISDKLREAEYRETMDRVTAVTHITVEHFSKHTKIEGYYEDQDVGHLFGCDRLMKAENLYGRIQMGYNPNRKRSFVFANIKTSIYDTVSSRYQKEMKEYQMKSLMKGQNQNRAYVARRKSESAVLFEKADTKPWSENTVRPYYGRVNAEALQKTMPFLARKKERDRLQEIRKERKELQQEIQRKIAEGHSDELQEPRLDQKRGLYEENFLEAMLQKKEAASRYFMRKINYAFDIQKHEMFEYYKNREKEKQQEAENLNDMPEDENNEE
ncbi:MAG: hypothetical protein ACI4DO_06735 [Roseburia sp.]